MNQTASKATGGPLGKVADKVLVERMQARALHESLENLKLLDEATHH
jgi:hypothetical protein